MKNTDKITARIIVELCHLNGVRDAVFSPGSRSAPLVIAFQNCKEITCHVIPDERVAGYFALGIAQYSGKKVAVICTSGTAVLNLAPAICEAFHQMIPLLAITADRPADKIGKGENQAINQQNIFKNYVLASYSLPLIISNRKEYNECIQATQEIIQKSSSFPNGPVHLNVPFEEPLYQMTNEVLPDFTINKETKGREIWAEESKQKFLDKINQAQKVWIVCGLLPKNLSLETELKKLSQEKRIPVFVETTSNLSSSIFISNYDSFFASLSEQEEREFLPDVLITIGKQIVSKRFRNYFKRNTCAVHFDVAENNENWQLFETNFYSLKVSISDVLSVVEQCSPKSQTYQNVFLKKSEHCHTFLRDYCSNIPFSDFKAYSIIASNLPEGTVINWGNSSPIRYANLFHYSSDTIHFSNRGTSGIDGCVSTASGNAIASKKLTLSIVGDVSFFYDSNSLWNAKLSPLLRIIIMNNQGGSIFRLIDGPKSVERFEEFFETKHNLSAEFIAETFGLDYYLCSDEKMLKSALPLFFDTAHKTACILEIKTDAALSETIFKDYYFQLKK